MTKPEKRGPRRAGTRPVPGSDPTPQALARGEAPVRAAEDTDAAWGVADRQGERAAGEGGSPVGENDEQLRRDVPPHWQ